MSVVWAVDGPRFVAVATTEEAVPTNTVALRSCAGWPRFRAGGLPALEDRPKTGRPGGTAPRNGQKSPRRSVAPAGAESMDGPGVGGAPGRAEVGGAEVLQRERIQPHRVRYYMHSSDPRPGVPGDAPTEGTPGAVAATALIETHRRSRGDGADLQPLGP